MCSCACTVSSTLQKGASPLHAASQEGHIEVVDALLSNGADPNLADVVGELIGQYIASCSL